MVKGLRGQFPEGEGPLGKGEREKGAKGVAGALVGQPLRVGPMGVAGGATPPPPLL